MAGYGRGKAAFKKSPILRQLEMEAATCTRDPLRSEMLEGRTPCTVAPPAAQAAAQRALFACERERGRPTPG